MGFGVVRFLRVLGRTQTLNYLSLRRVRVVVDYCDWLSNFS